MKTHPYLHMRRLVHADWDEVSIQTLYLNLHCIQQPGRRFTKLLKDKDGLKETFAFMRWVPNYNVQAQIL